MVATMVLSETHGLVVSDSWPGAFLGYPRGHRVIPETGCVCTSCLTALPDTHPRTRASEEPIRPTASYRSAEDGTWLSTEDAQAACDFGFNFSASKFAPFFHSAKAIAAILRARVSRAIVGLMPLASSA